MVVDGSPFHNEPGSNAGIKKDLVKKRSQDGYTFVSLNFEMLGNKPKINKILHVK